MKKIHLIILTIFISHVSYCQTCQVSPYTGKYSVDLKHAHDKLISKPRQYITLTGLGPTGYYNAVYELKDILVEEKNVACNKDVQIWRKEKLKNLQNSLDKKLYSSCCKKFGTKYARDILRGDIKIGMPLNAVLMITPNAYLAERVVLEKEERWVSADKYNNSRYFYYFKNDSLVRWINLWR
jgi:hypothetical protein